MKALTYTLCLEQPLLATSQEGDPNSSRSFDYIPGSLIRGLLIARYRELENVAGDNLLADEIATRRFFNGFTRYLNAYPLLNDRSRALPTPLSVRQPKDGGDKALNLADPAGRTLLEEAGMTAQFRVPGKPFCAQTEGFALTYKPDHTVAIHIQRDRAFGRARRGSGEVFRYDALAAGQYFAGAILCDDDADVDALRKLLVDEPIAWLGRSRSAHYGRVRFEGLRIEGDWRELDADLPEAGTTLTMTLLSDLLLRDAAEDEEAAALTPWGRELLGPDAAALSAALGFAVELEAEGCFTATTLAGSYNSSARLPGLQRHALRAGSVITLRLLAPVDRAMLTAAEWAGLGERRAEGYGRVTFGWPQGPQLAVGSARPYSPPTVESTEPLSPAGGRLAALMATRLLEQQIDQAIALFVRDQVSEKAGVVATMPESSQLGRVRVLIRRALPKGDVGSVRTGLAELKQTAREQFERARIDGRSLDRWLEALLADPPSGGAAQVWKELRLDPTTVQVATIVAPADPRLARITALRLAEATLAAAARQRQREAQP